MGRPRVSGGSWTRSTGLRTSSTGSPRCGVSVALVDGREVLAGAIDAPFLGQRWHAVRGGGATWRRATGPREPAASRNAPSPRRSSRPVSPSGAGSSYHDTWMPSYWRLDAAEDLRRPGAACLDLAWVACGVFDGFFELALAAWDVAAGGLLVREAGGVVTDWEGGSDYLTGDILAGPQEVWDALRRATSG